MAYQLHQNRTVSAQQNMPQVVTLGAIEMHNITQSKIQPHFDVLKLLFLYPAAYRTATVMPNRSLFRIPISTSLKVHTSQMCRFVQDQSL